MTINHLKKRLCRSHWPVAAFVVSLWASAPYSATAAQPDSIAATPTVRLFASEAEAHAHCPTDKPIRIELPDGFFLHGDRGFGGASLDHVYICRDEVTRLFAGRRS
jgi:hypothetical protein